MKAVIIGAGPAGLATAACLKAAGVAVEILDRAQQVGSSWRRHYDCLHLHTARSRSGLPGLKFPARVGRYPSLKDVITYLEDYTRHHGLAPRFGCEVTGIARQGSGWQVTHSGGQEMADIIVMATSINGTPRRPDWPGAFDGPVLHSSQYRNAAPYAGKRVLVVGFGNSGGDIALDLANAGVDVALSVRGAVNILPKQLFGIPITSYGMLTKLLGYRTADLLTAPVLRLAVGRPEDYGLQSMSKGPAAMVHEDERIPMIDAGALGAIKAGKITVRPGVSALDGASVSFADGTSQAYDAIIAAIGYTVDLRPLLGDDCAALDARGHPILSGGPTSAKGLYFCSFRVSPYGQLLATGQEAMAIAQHVETLATPA
jgi:cation diffusion facilitator CzcD-associated flavoprotein CzcO